MKKDEEREDMQYDEESEEGSGEDISTAVDTAILYAHLCPLVC